MKHKLPFIKYYYLVVWIAEKNYPSKYDLTKLLEEKELFLSERTLYRHIKDIKNLYNIPIAYCHINKGYFIDKNSATHYETDRFLQLMQEMITANSVRTLFAENSKYLKHLEFESQPSQMFQDVFEELLTVIQQKVHVQFSHYSYQKNQTENYQVKPLFLKQYQNRWYLIAEHNKIHKAFALDRINDLEKTNTKFKADLTKVKQAYTQIVGLTNDDNKKIEHVQLRFHSSQKNYVKSVPIHKQQQEIADNANEYTIAFYVKPNFELKQQVLKYGSLVEVLQPPALRQEIKQEYQKALKLYKENRK